VPDPCDLEEFGEIDAVGGHAMEEHREGRGLSRRREEYLFLGCPVKRITSSTKDKDGINTYTNRFEMLGLYRV
jgi:hypothetical protein